MSDDQVPTSPRGGTRRWMLGVVGKALGAGVVALAGISQAVPASAMGAACRDQCRREYVACGSACASNYKECLGSGAPQSVCQEGQANCVAFCKNQLSQCLNGCV